MGYFDTSHLVDEEITLGPAYSFSENVAQGMAQQYRIDSPFSFEAEIKEWWEDSLRAMEAMTGQPAGFRTELEDIKAYASVLQGTDPNDLAGTYKLENRLDLPNQIARFKQLNDQIKSLNNPDIKSLETVLQEVIEMQQATEEETGRMAETSGWAGTIGQFLGAAAGSFTDRDPVNLMTLGIGGFGRTTVKRLATEMGIAGVAAAATDYGFVQENRAAAGLPERNPLYDIVAASVGAGLIRGTFEIGGAVTRRFGPSGPQISLDFDDAQLRSLFEQTAPNSPRARAALAMLDADDVLVRASPYGASESGLARFTAELDEVIKIIGGGTETAVARALPEVPFEYIHKNADFELVREQVPEVYARFEVAEQNLQAIETRLADVEQTVGNLPFMDAIERINPASGQLVRSFEEDLANPQLTRQQRADIERRVNQVVESIGPNNIEKAAREIDNVARRELKTTRASRKAANKRYKAAYKDVISEVEKIRVRERIIKGVAPTEAPSVLHYSPVLGPSMRHEVVALRAADIEQTADAIDLRAEQIISRPELEGEAVLPDDGLVDIGLAERVPDYDFPTEDGSKTSFKAALADLRQDADLLEAMRVCSL